MKAMESLERVMGVVNENPRTADDFLFWTSWYLEDAVDDMSFIDYLKQTYLEQTSMGECSPLYAEC